MKLLLAITAIFLLACNDAPIKEYYKKTNRIIKSVKARELPNGSIICTLKFVGGGMAVVDDKKGSCLHEGDTIEVITYASDSL